MTFLFWSAALVGTVTGFSILAGARWPYMLYDMYAVWLEHRRDCFQCWELREVSPGQPAGDTGTGKGRVNLPPSLAARPGTIRGPLSNGRNR